MPCDEVNPPRTAGGRARCLRADMSSSVAGVSNAANAPASCRFHALTKPRSAVAASPPEQVGAGLGLKADGFAVVGRGLLPLPSVTATTTVAPVVT